MQTRRLRRWLLGTLVVAALASALFVTRVPLGAGHPAAAAARTLTATADVDRDPWFGLELLQARVELIPAAALAAPSSKINAAAAILIDADTGRILYQLDAHRHLAPASTIKLLSALVALTNFDPRQLVSITADALDQAWDESKMGLHAGDRLTIRELLTGMLMVSANDAATALAVDTVGMERYVAAMNAEAAALGLHDTHATSPVGLDDPGTYSSAYDIASMALIDVDEFPLFDTIVRTRYEQIPASALHPAFSLDNINLLLGMYPAAIGIKTGYTGDAGGCLVAEAVRGGHRLISVMLNANYVYSQSRRLLDWGFAQYGLPLQYPTPAPSPSASPRH